MAGAIAAMKVLKDTPEVALNAVEGLYRITLEEFECMPEPLRRDWVITKSANSLAVEFNFHDQWSDGKTGIPIFSIEDMYSGSHVLQNCMSHMGMIPTIAYDANIFISNGIGNIDEEGGLIEAPTRLSVKAMFKAIEIISRYSGLLS